MDDENLYDVPITASNPILSFNNQKQKIIKQYVYLKCDCKRKRAYEFTIMDLPRVIMVEILSRLPIKSIFRSKTVCKRWYNIFSADPLFLKLYSPSPCILLNVDDPFNSILDSILELKADYDYNTRPRDRPIMLSSKFHLPQLNSKMFGYDHRGSYVKPQLKLMGSSNGFLCLLNGDRHDHEAHSVYISNPLLGEYFKLKLPEWEKRVRNVTYGFCFCEASGQYKVLRSLIRKFRGRPEVSELEVYTLGVGEKWRNVGEVPYPLRGSFGNVNVNSALHCLDDENHFKRATSICSFNIETEKVRSLPVPPGVETPSLGLTLIEFGNCLCLSDSNYSQYVDIWCMKKYGIAESWTRDRILAGSIPFNIVVPIINWKDGEILMQNHHGALVSYNQKEKKLRKINVYGSGTAVARYAPSFYSLKTVMGDCFQVSNVYPKTEIV